ncbi:STM4015 family protein [Catellatospora tritici]|uniref:STM4015 family protein n=1 Tax=Catellatospora tritici TaxID=2851566 RepID=UPI001C2D92ED|nr:STM4015 family protein [Catellatospora tritici]MBV1856170.1 STM4015 family protein [Catellatospora tritici]
MTINEHISRFAGLPVAAFDPHGDVPADPAAYAWRVDTDYDGGAELFQLRFDGLVNADWAHLVTALVIGEWGEAYDSPAPIEALVAAADRLPALRALFLGEMTYDEQEISWITQGDVTPLLRAYPRLEVLSVRGAVSLELAPVRHDRLRELTFESGGLPAHVVRAVGECELPALQHLELWLGTANYGGDATAEDLAAILSGTRLPALTSLGVRDCEIVDQIAAALAGAPVVARLEQLDLSLGVLTDAGGAALLAGQPLTHLKRLDLHHHFLSEPMMDRLSAELEAVGVELDLNDAGDPDDDDRFISVSE